MPNQSAREEQKMKLSIKARAATAFLLVCVAIVPVIAQQDKAAPADKGGGPGRSLGLLVRMSTVQKELQLTSDQIEKINEMRPPQGGPPRGGQGGWAAKGHLVVVRTVDVNRRTIRWQRSSIKTSLRD